MRHRYLLWLLFPLLAACTAATPPAAPAPTPMVFQPMLGRALAFLARQYDPDTGLLHAAPDRADETWLLPDNLLVEWVLQDAHAAQLSVELETSLERYGAPEHGLVELLKGASVTWPPRSAVQQEAASGILLETFGGDGTVADWSATPDLALFAVLDAWNRQDTAQARTRFDAALQLFDGTGFRRDGDDGPYTTAHLALALLVGERIGQPVNDAIIRRLLSLQRADGGFAAHYSADGAGDGADTQTTAYALLALYALRQPTE